MNLRNRFHEFDPSSYNFFICRFLLTQGMLGDQSERQAIYQRFISGEKLFVTFTVQQQQAAAAEASKKGGSGSSGGSGGATASSSTGADDEYDELKLAEEEISARMAARGANRRVAPMVTLTSNSVLKCVGKYIGLMESLAPVWNDARFFFV